MFTVETSHLNLDEITVKRISDLPVNEEIDRSSIFVSIPISNCFFLQNNMAYSKIIKIIFKFKDPVCALIIFRLYPFGLFKLNVP